MLLYTGVIGRHKKAVYSSTGAYHKKYGLTIHTYANWKCKRTFPIIQKHTSRLLKGYKWNIGLIVKEVCYSNGAVA